MSEGKKEKRNHVDLRDFAPRMYLTSVEKYYRRFSDIPSDFVQTTANADELITLRDILESLNPNRVKHRRHIMVVGRPATAKSTILQKVLETFVDDYGLIGGHHALFLIDFRCHSEDDITSVPKFLYKTRPKFFDDEQKDTLCELILEKPHKAFFLFSGLDTVSWDITTDFETIRDLSSAKTSVIALNILSGRLFPNCKILTSCREYKVKDFQGDLRPHRIIQVGELSHDAFRSLARELLGKKIFQSVLKIWDENSPITGVLNRNATYLADNIASGGKGNTCCFAHSVPMTILHMLVCCTYGNRYPVQMQNNKRALMPIFAKMKQMAYHGIIEQKHFFKEKEATDRFGIANVDTKLLSIGYPFNDKTKLTLVEDRYPESFYFSSRPVQEFLCALVIVDQSIAEFKVFLRDCIHLKRYHMVRRMLCAIVFDPIVWEVAYKEKLIRAEMKDIKQRRKLLEASMSAEFHRAKRLDLLEFFHAVRDAGDFGTSIIPQTLDTIDLRHIRLFSLDMHAIGTCIANCEEIGHLDLSDCEISPDGLEVLANAVLENTRMKVKKLTLDWNTGWKNSYKGILALSHIILPCAVDDLSINHTGMTRKSLEDLNSCLVKAKLTTLRIQHNNSLCKDKGSVVLGDFVQKHKVEHLYVSTADVTDEAEDDFLEGFSCE